MAEHFNYVYKCQKNKIKKYTKIKNELKKMAQ